MTKEKLGVRGFYRVQIEDGPTGEIVGDSGWIENQVTNEGKLRFLVNSLGNLGGDLYVSHVAIGTGGVPASNATTLAGECASRTTVTAASSGSSGVRFTATFNSTGSFVAAQSNLSNIGLFNSITTGYLFAGNTFTSSTCNTNQNVNVTYDITF